MSAVDTRQRASERSHARDATGCAAESGCSFGVREIVGDAPRGFERALTGRRAKRRDSAPLRGREASGANLSAFSAQLFRNGAPVHPVILLGAKQNIHSRARSPELVRTITQVGGEAVCVIQPMPTRLAFGSVGAHEEDAMYLIREVVRCKAGKVRPMVEKFRVISALMKDMGHDPLRLLTDVSGEPFWTVVAEAKVDKIDDFFTLERTLMANATLQKVMADYHDLVEQGRREIYRVED
jgi:hypothetical protein